MDLTREFEPDEYAEGLAAWDFLDLSGQEPVLATAFGDVILQSEEGFSFLDLEAGTLASVWATQNDLLADLNSPRGQTRFLRAWLVREATDVLGEPDTSQVFGFRRNLVLGGSETVENVGLTDFAVALDLAGQIHSQLRRLPPGTRISGITLA